MTDIKSMHRNGQDQSKNSDMELHLDGFNFAENRPCRSPPTLVI
jgi:hypothetical protein